MRKFNKKNFNKEQLDKKLRRYDSVNINGETIDKNNEESKYRIMSGIERLNSKGLAEFSTISKEAAALINMEPLTADALTVLSSIGISVDVTYPADLDLKDDIDDLTTIDNPNIEDKDLKKMKNKLVDAKDKFPDPEDTFYKLGTKQRQFKQAKLQSDAPSLPEVAIQKLTADISAVCLSPQHGGNLEQFKK